MHLGLRHRPGVHTIRRLPLEAYHLAAIFLFFVSVFIPLRRLLGRWFRPTPRFLAVHAKGMEDRPRKSARKSIVERLRDWALPNLPMV